MREPYHIEVSRSARRGLYRLPERVAPAIIELLTQALPENPLRISKPLSGEFLELRSARRGDYRVIFRVDEERKTVLVHRIAHRTTAYRPR